LTRAPLLAILQVPEHKLARLAQMSSRIELKVMVNQNVVCVLIEDGLNVTVLEWRVQIVYEELTNARANFGLLRQTRDYNP